MEAPHGSTLGCGRDHQEARGRYYHCPHCGQIIPLEGFSKCPRCFQVPVYHGYEPTCWRQWPEGWGCPPESVVNNPEFWSQGMVESDVVVEETTVEQGATEYHNSLENSEPVEVPSGEPAPLDGGVSLSPPQHDVVQADPRADSASEPSEATEEAQRDAYPEFSDMVENAVKSVLEPIDANQTIDANQPVETQPVSVLAQQTDQPQPEMPEPEDRCVT